MAIRTSVAVFVPGTDERGNQVGTGSLMAPKGVLVHPPLSRRLVEEQLADLRVCVASWQDLRGCSVEVIDVASVHLVDMGHQDLQGITEPLVALELSRPSAAEPNPPLTTADEVERFLRDPFNGPATDWVHYRPNILCRAVGLFCRPPRR